MDICDAHKFCVLIVVIHSKELKHFGRIINVYLYDYLIVAEM